jgi:hypothetical protein
MAIWQDLVDDHGFGAGYVSVKRFVGRLKAAEPVDDAHPRIEIRAKSRRQSKRITGYARLRPQRRAWRGRARGRPRSSFDRG